MKKNEMKFILILIAITVIIGGICIFAVKNKGKKGTTNVQTDLFDVNDEAYAGKKIYEEDGDIIIESENGGKTIESTKGEETDLKPVSEEEKTKYEISDVKVEVEGNRTIVKGKVKNNTKAGHKVNVQIKFYDSNDRVKGSASTEVEEVGTGKTKEFEMSIMGSMKDYTYKAEVTYTN